MNIFVTNPCPKESAKALDDKRVIKMILETAQMLSTVVRLEDEEYADQKGLYKKTHMGHPCVRWASENRGNYSWLIEHMKALMDEYTARFGKQHKSGSLLEAICGFTDRMPDGQATPFVNCTDFKHVDDVHDAYRQALSSKWKNDKIQPRWTRTLPPEWMAV